MSKHTAVSDGYETTCRATELGLSFSQMCALDWLRAQSQPIFRRDYRNAGVSTQTINSLINRGLVTFGRTVPGAFECAHGIGEAVNG